MTHDGRVEAAIVVPSGISLSATSNAGGPTAVNLAAGTYLGISAFCTYLATALNAQRPVTAGSWTVTISTGAAGTGKVTIAVTNGTCSITWTSTDLRDLLGFTGNFGPVASSTGASQALGLWIPDCPIAADIDLKQGPIATDRRSTSGPTGVVYTRRGTSMYRHTNLRWSHVALNRVWQAEESTTNQSYERFFRDTQEGIGHAWFSPGSAVVIVDHRGTTVGSARSITSWNATRLPGLDTLRQSVDGYNGLYRIEWPEIVSSG